MPSILDVIESLDPRGRTDPHGLLSGDFLRGREDRYGILGAVRGGVQGAFEWNQKPPPKPRRRKPPPKRIRR